VYETGDSASALLQLNDSYHIRNDPDVVSLPLPAAQQTQPAQSLNPESTRETTSDLTHNHCLAQLDRTQEPFTSL
jgi:hypothetical protein